MALSKPLLLLTNDDGAQSPGLHALARALRGLGDLLIVAPRAQQSAMGRALTGRCHTQGMFLAGLEGTDVAAYAVDASPALCVRYALMILAQRPVAMVVAGVNYGENIGTGVTISGTVCAAIEGASFGVPALAVSLETEIHDHFSHNDQVSFDAAAALARRLAERTLHNGLPAGVDLLKVDLPMTATPESRWALTRLTRQRYYEPVIAAGDDGLRRLAGYRREVDLETLENDSDAHALLVRREISICPMSVDLSCGASWPADWSPL